MLSLLTVSLFSLFMSALKDAKKWNDDCCPIRQRSKNFGQALTDKAGGGESQFPSHNESGRNKSKHNLAHGSKMSQIVSSHLIYHGCTYIMHTFTGDFDRIAPTEFIEILSALYFVMNSVVIA